MTASSLRRALRIITERLASELFSPSPVAPDWSDYEWRLAAAVAAMHGISPLLAGKLRWRGPVWWAAFLSAQRTHTERRHSRTLRLLQTLDEGLRVQGIGAIALKGAALHEMRLYVPGERPMADVDLLVRPIDAQRAGVLIESLGFQESGRTWKERVFTPIVGRGANAFGEHEQNDLKIELHERICERLPLRITDVSSSVHPQSAQPGLNAYPSTASLMIHLLLHASGCIAFKSLRLLHVYDLALLSARMSAQDWEELLRIRTAGPAACWAWPPLQIANGYYPLNVPEGVLRALRKNCPPLLRVLTRQRQISDISHSYPCVDAFPGVEWCRTLPEVAAYAFSRLVPACEHLALRDALVLSQPWAADVQWSSLPQARRIGRWLISRPVRPPTLHAVNLALDAF